MMHYARTHQRNRQEDEESVQEPKGLDAIKARRFSFETGRRRVAVTSPSVTPMTDPSPSELRYVLVSPCRDEAQHMRRTLDSVAAQTVPPALWVVVDDGSTDATPTILDEYVSKLPYLKVVRRVDRGQRSVGPGVVEAFYAGLDTINLDDFPFLCKLDLDL